MEGSSHHSKTMGFGILWVFLELKPLLEVATEVDSETRLKKNAKTVL